MDYALLKCDLQYQWIREKTLNQPLSKIWMLLPVSKFPKTRREPNVTLQDKTLKDGKRSSGSLLLIRRSWGLYIYHLMRVETWLWKIPKIGITWVSKTSTKAISVLVSRSIVLVMALPLPIRMFFSWVLTKPWVCTTVRKVGCVTSSRPVCAAPYTRMVKIRWALNGTRITIVGTKWRKRTRVPTET